MFTVIGKRPAPPISSQTASSGRAASSDDPVQPPNKKPKTEHSTSPPAQCTKSSTELATQAALRDQEISRQLKALEKKRAAKRIAKPFV